MPFSILNRSFRIIHAGLSIISALEIWYKYRKEWTVQGTLRWVTRLKFR